ncbi:hypothetical protein OBBRIDRAFT_98896 [Obba rivulosa]|uniref:Uncharacterized protein n=1 Tax=Obba rivulosa TaxID=1052685 RepID=A0A8E2AU89_9APHY|nr:hypothetical protein OBBRIDRAFT_98896 [Obba rivulosa]
MPDIELMVPVSCYAIWQCLPPAWWTTTRALQCGWTRSRILEQRPRLLPSITVSERQFEDIRKRDHYIYNPTRTERDLGAAAMMIPALRRANDLCKPPCMEDMCIYRSGLSFWRITLALKTSLHSAPWQDISTTGRSLALGCYGYRSLRLIAGLGYMR